MKKKTEPTEKKIEFDFSEKLNAMYDAEIQKIEAEIRTESFMISFSPDEKKGEEMEDNIKNLEAYLKQLKNLKNNI